MISFEIIRYPENKKYFTWISVKRKSHREGDNVACIRRHPDGKYSKEYNIEGLCHREKDKPAYILLTAEGKEYRKYWYLNGQMYKKIEKSL